MRRALFLLSFLTIVLVMWAGDVTPEQALKQAQNFVQNQVTAGRRAPGATPQLALKGTVSGLYVFNVADDEGFVIVSNDDRTTPVLGYSTSGSIDPDNMPDNMRAWLQGYADEIAWMNEHNIQPASQSSSRRTNRSVKTAITPLVQTQWNQGEPYNNNCPKYAKYVSENTYSEISTVTGCVATAMAQVMCSQAKKSHISTTTTSQAIPQYQSKTCLLWNKAMNSVSYNVEEKPIATINWDAMTDTYPSSDEANSAVALLMEYVGASVQMQYGTTSHGGSSASSSYIPLALTTYFGYDASVQLVNRDNYSYADWIEILYYELSNGRPILYGGQSTGGGHEFVCDGYQGEDYFHINWGWGGSSDDYFKLSVLNPYEHGIGGSSNKTGFNFAQDAVIGIQLNGAGGSVSGLVTSGKNEIKLSVTSFSFSPESGIAKAGEEITCTINVTNNSTKDDFDGDIIVHEKTNNMWLNGKNVQLSAGKSKVIQIPFTIKDAGNNYKMHIINSLGYQISSDPISFVVVDAESSSNDVELTVTKKSVDNTELRSGYPDRYNLYGNKFRATINMKNDTGTNYEGKLFWKLLPGSFSGTFTFESQSVTVPKNSNIDVIIEMDNIDMSVEYYRLCYCHKKGDSHTTIWDGYYYPQAAIMTYDKDGTKIINKSTESFEVPETALSVDLTGITGIEITPNSNPNCLFILSSGDEIPTVLENKNVIIRNNGSSYSAANISLTDGSDFYSPVDFTAANIEYTYDYEGKAGGTGKAADGTNGWSTIMLPYDVTSVTANDTPIDWFHSETDGGGQFWLKKFTDDSVGTVNFNFVEENGMKAYTPYIIALPGNRWGTSHQLNDKTIKFIGTNVTVYNGSTLSTITGSNYRFIGKTVTDGTENIYCLNADGNQFELNASDGSKPFRAYFKADTFDRTMTSLAIGSGSGTTGIQTFEPTSKPHTDSWYTLDGRRISGQPTQKGLYIVNGKKTVIK